MATLGVWMHTLFVRWVLGQFKGAKLYNNDKKMDSVVLFYALNGVTEALGSIRC